MFKRQQVSSSLPYFILLQQGDLQWFEPSAIAMHFIANKYSGAGV